MCSKSRNEQPVSRGADEITSKTCRHAVGHGKRAPGGVGKERARQHLSLGRRRGPGSPSSHVMWPSARLATVFPGESAGLWIEAGGGRKPVRECGLPALLCVRLPIGQQ